MKQDTTSKNGAVGHSEKLTKLLSADISKMTQEEYKQHSINVLAEHCLEYDKEADFFTFEYEICKKSLYTYSLNDLILGDDLYLGEIKRSGLQDIWAEWDANKRKVGTKIYQYPDWNEKIIAVQGVQRMVYDKPTNHSEEYDGELGQLLHLDTRNFTPEQNKIHTKCRGKAVVISQI
jgi:hypothetical protein